VSPAADAKDAAAPYVMRTFQASWYRVKVCVLVWKGAISMTIDRAIADFGKAATVLHRLIHESAPLTNIQLQFLTTELQTLEIALKTHYPKSLD
jgi:hypothetical protein